MQQFSVLVWNLHKENHTDRFTSTLSALLQEYEPDIVLFQEVALHQHIPLLSHYNQTTHNNIQFANNSFGVLSASKLPIVEKQKITTHYKEFYIATKKSLLITTHLLDNHPVTVVNTHAINFVPHSVFEKELHRLMDRLSIINHPLIVTGDFNTWSDTRLNLLKSFATQLSLQPAEIEQQHHIKSFYQKPLDHLLYSKLSLQKAIAIDTKDVSDHNPIYGVFEL